MSYVYHPMKTMSLTRPERFYWDGIKLWGIYPTLRSKSKKYFKGSIDYKEEEKLFQFKSYHSTISREKAEEKFPEYFI